MTQILQTKTKWGGLGWHPGLPKFGSAQYIPQVATLPVSVDLRPNCPAVYDQGQLGSCTANAVGGLAQFLMMKEQHTSFVPSRLAIYYWERVIENSVSQDSGASISDSLAVVSNTGCPHESLWWYNINKFAVRPNNKVVADANKHKITSAMQVNNTSLATMQSCLSSGFPITIGFTVYSSFESSQVARTGIVPMPNSHEQILGGHAVLIVGYDNTRNWFIVRNSWGAGWGAAGYFYMPYQYFTNSNLASDAWTARLIA
jgi:C1A family cysteine protease